jgi:hypothetical protein
MKQLKKIRSARPTARLYIRKLNQLFFFAEHQFKKFKKKKKANPIQENSDNFKFESLVNWDSSNLPDISEIISIKKL